MILMTGHAPMSFVIPSFPRDVSFIRIDGWLVQGADHVTGLAQRMHARVAAHRGPLYVLFADDEIEGAISALRHYDLQARIDNACMEVTSNIADSLTLCPVQSVNTSGASIGVVQATQ